MSASFSFVEDKVYETEFFLTELNKTKYLSAEATYYFSAFVSASRSITFTLQYCMKGINGFEEWYNNKIIALKTDCLAPFFIEIRNDIIHKGINIYNKVTPEHMKELFYLQIDKNRRNHWMVLPKINDTQHSILIDAQEASKVYFISLLSIIYDCYDRFRMTVDPHWYFTEEHFHEMGKTIEDALIEIGFPPTWVPKTVPESEAWKILRRLQPFCPLNSIFEKYLGKMIVAPDEASS